MAHSKLIDIDPQFSMLFTPLRDPKNSWNIDIKHILETYIQTLLVGKSVNFVNAALIIQASSNVYGKKVENLYTLAMQLATCMNGGEKKQPGSTKDKDLQSRSNDDFTLVNDLKRSKNLDIVDDRVVNIHSKNALKYLPSVPPDLIPLEDSEKGDINLIDLRGEVLGNKKDFFINICRMHSSGYLLLPTVYMDNAPTDSVDMESQEENEPLNVELNRDADDGGSLDGGDVHMSPLLSPLANDGLSPSGPLEDIADEIVEEAVPDIAPRRRSMRQVEKVLEKESLTLEKQNAWVTSNQDKVPVSTKKIQKKNTRKLPKKLKKSSTSDLNQDDEELNSTSEFCSKTFFSTDQKLPKNGLPKNDIEAFDELFLENAQRQAQDLKALSKEVDLNGEQNENGNSPDSDDDTGGPPPDDGTPSNDDDIPIERSMDTDGDTPLESNMDDVPVAANYEEFVQKHIADYMKDVGQYSQTTDISVNVRIWEDNVKPILDEQNTHEPFDIHIYGKRILDSFVDNNRKQTFTFQDFCKHKRKWQVHRYFLASLQLANNYNIKLSLTDEGTGTSIIYMTLLSRKQHHEEIAEFGHATGSHSS